MEFTTDILTPLEQARNDWYPMENPTTYFEVARDVMLGAGVDIRNPDYDPEVP